MIIKSHSRKTPTFAQLLDYLNLPSQKGPAILHNLITAEDHPGTILAELLDNYRHLRTRKNGNALYHEILSFSGKDSQYLTPEVLEDLTRQYIHLRCPDALVYAKAHFDTENPHVHLLISANNVGTKRPHRISKSAFRQVKRELERHQRLHFPELVHSLAQKDHEKTPERKAESELARRLNRMGKVPRKAEVQQLTAEALGASNSITSLRTHIQLLGLDLYHRGNTTGVLDRASGRRYRLKTLGLLEQYEALLSSSESLCPEKKRRLEDLKRLPSHVSTPHSLSQDKHQKGGFISDSVQAADPDRRLGL